MRIAFKKMRNMRRKNASRRLTVEASPPISRRVENPSALRRIGREFAPDSLQQRPPTSANTFSLTGAGGISPWSKRAKRICLAGAILLLFLPLGGSSAAYRKHLHQPPSDSSFADRVATYVAEAAERFAIPARWIYAVMHVESAGQRHAVSPKGAMGLMQIMPKTWNDLRRRYGLGPDPFVPRDNILAGAAYLRELHDRYGSPGDLAAYNAGPQRYEAYRDRHLPLPAETKAYVARLAPVVGVKPLPDRPNNNPVGQSLATAASLFASHAAAQPSAVRRAPAPQQDQQATRPLSRGHVTDLTAITPRATGLFVRLSSMEPTP